MAHTLSKYDGRYILEITATKDVYEDDWNEGEGGCVQSGKCDALHGRYHITKDTDVADLIVRHFNKSIMVIEDFTQSDFEILYERVVTSTTENGNGDCVIGTEANYNKQKIYSCHYDMYFSINGKHVEAHDLRNLVNFKREEAVRA